MSDFLKTIEKELKDLDKELKELKERLKLHQAKHTKLKTEGDMYKFECFIDEVNIDLHTLKRYYEANKRVQNKISFLEICTKEGI